MCSHMVGSFVQGLDSLKPSNVLRHPTSVAQVDMLQKRLEEGRERHQSFRRVPVICNTRWILFSGVLGVDTCYAYHDLIEVRT